MNEIDRIEQQLRLGVEGEAWHGESLYQALKGVTAEQAAKHPIGNAHSIWELVLHCGAWMGAVHERLEGVARQTPTEGDFPAVTGTREAEWRDALLFMQGKYRALLKTIQEFDEAQLDAAVAGSDRSAYIQMHGIIQHNAYHAGQIVLLKKS